MKRGRVCLFGPPGTGKSAFARHLATELDVPIISRSASDLLSKWLGETEQALRDMFDEARSERALLLLDEADSFFRSRARSMHSWEVTQVNELLVQMETFEGVFVCTTNLMEDVDEAALRRFTLKIRFDPMTADQRWRMFEKTLEALDGELGGDRIALRASLDRLDRLTPGDFAVVAERIRLLGEPVSADELLRGLGGELAAKPGAPRALGFAR
jgi:transitional endoplasmic reticulum ATPase